MTFDLMEDHSQAIHHGMADAGEDEQKAGLRLDLLIEDPESIAALVVSNAQATVWLQRLVGEGVIEKQKKPAGYIVKQSSLFE